MKKSYPWRYAAFMITYYTVNAIYQGYISKYFQLRGAATAQLSVLLAAAPMISIVSQPFWGMRGDRAKSRNRVLRLMILLGVGLILMLPLSNAFGWMLLFNALFAAQYTSIQPMGDSIILESLLARGNQPFGPLRLCGSLSFAVVNLGFGLLVGERFEWVIWLSAALLAGVFLSTYLLPSTPGHQAETGRKMSLVDLFRVPGMPPLLALFMMLQLCMGYFYSFFSIHFTALPGGSMTLLGLAYFISATSELPFLLNADRLFDRLGAGRLMCLSALTMLTRWVLLATCPNVAVVLCSQLLHGGGFIVMSVSMAKHINATVPAELKSSGQLLLAVAGFGLARVFGILGGGLLSGALGGTRHAFLVMAGVCALALILFAPRYFRRAKAN